MIVSGRMSTVVVATPDVVGARMAGPGIRAWNIARQMAKVAPTTLVAKVEGEVWVPASAGTARAEARAHTRIVDKDSAEARDAMHDAAAAVDTIWSRGASRPATGAGLHADVGHPSP